MINYSFLNSSFLRVTLFDPQTFDHKDLYFNLYDTPLSKKWLKEFQSVCNNNKSIRNFNLKYSKEDSEELKIKINECIEKINKFYDIEVNKISKIDNDSLNVLYDHYSLYGKRNEEKLNEKWWESAHKTIPFDDPRVNIWPGIKFNEEMHFAFVELNNLIYKSKIILEYGETKHNPEFVISACFNKIKNYQLKEEDIPNLKQTLDFGDLCLGNNASSKTLRHIVQNFDKDSLEKNLISPQQTWSNEIFISMQKSNNNPFWILDYYNKWKSLDVEKFGYKFGDYQTNKEGYYCIGRLCPQQMNELYDYGYETLKVDLSNFSEIYDLTLISKEQFELEIVDQQKRIPLWYKPRQTLVDKKIKKILKSNRVIVTWILNNVCNYSCRYCPPDLHNGKNYKIEWEEIKDFVDHIIETYSTDNRKIEFNLSGGEPTMSPFFPELIKRIYDLGHVCRLTTNLSRTPRFVEENFKYLFSVSCSFHPHFEFKNNTADQFLEKIKISSKLTMTSIRLMMDPMYWDQCIDFIERVRRETTVELEPVMIETNYGGNVTKLCDIAYTEEQLEWFKNYKFKRINKPIILDYRDKLSYRDFSSDAIVEYESGKLERFFAFQELINNGQTKFFKYVCNIGESSLYISPTGDIKKANCHVGGVWGNRQEWKKINWGRLTEPVICSQLECSCGADMPITKFKRDIL